MRTKAITLLTLAVLLCSLVFPVCAITLSTFVSPGGLQEQINQYNDFYYNASLGQLPIVYTIPSSGVAESNYYYWLHSIDHNARFDLVHAGATYATVDITTTDLGYDSYYNYSAEVGHGVRYDYTFSSVNASISDLTGTIHFVGNVIYDNLTYYKYLSYGTLYPYCTQFESTIDNRVKIAEDIGIVSWHSPFNNTFSKTGVYQATYGAGGPPPSTGCNLTATVQNTANSNAVAGSTIHIYDLTAATSESYYLPWGTGSVGIPHTGDLYQWNATKPGWTGYPAFPEAGVSITAESCPFTTLFTQLTGPPAAATNCTLSFEVYELNSYLAGTPLAIPGAHIILSDGQNGITNLAGFTSFNTAKNASYDYTVTAQGYLGYTGNVTIGASDDAIIVTVPLSSGIVPTATATTYAPGTPHDTSDDALKFILNNMLNIIYLLFLMFIVGALKMMGKK